GPQGPPGPPSGPYGVPPGGPPPGAPGQQNRTPLYIAIGVVAVIALIAVIVIATSGGGDDETSSSTTTEQAPTTEDPSGGGTTAPPSTEAPSGGGSTAVDGLEVVDHGFSDTSYGFIIENTSDEARVNFTVDVALYDTGGTAIGSESHSVGRINAGERLGIGYDIFDEAPEGVGRLEFSFEEGYNESAPEGTFSVSEVTTETDDYGTETSFTVASTYEVDLESTYAYAIYRDASGKIIGGTYGFVDLVPAGGTARGSITSFEPVQGVSATEVYVDQGYF
ncbi:MAG TPA: hypothetical protein VJM49_12935, partial [Acidimicrobiales bacterium]|nr:hypothetical protein [Acidimicrobiales bacterium]